MKKTERNYARFFSLLRAVMPEMDREEAKAIVVDQASKGRTTSLHELTDEEWREAIGMLEDRKADSSVSLKSARSQALHQLQLYGVRTTDWDEVNKFTSDARIAGKLFYHLSVGELSALTRKLRAMVEKKRETEAKDRVERRRIKYVSSVSLDEPLKGCNYN
ncbi:MAG: hypothetical protein PUK66_07195 [Bacteroidales bacterium]|uniref:hypothetical protein n=1 Tax=Porphyromonas sp. TaxID=1924944 RepID=UPI0029785AC4|nr:hypothetical protein [Porphyromonas sp.]MDD7438597.1 hypothetical protein [Bacteroidales bacterium]MDY3067853.1 hypothetical protein [Porphyromonas sp.]